MKPLNLVLLPLLFAALGAACQEKLTEKDAPAFRYGRYGFELVPLKVKEPLSFPADTIEVLDRRQDTSKFGYFHTVAAWGLMQFCFKGGTASGIGSFLNNSFTRHSPPSNGKLVYCLKKLWIEKADTIDMKLRKPNLTRSRVYFKAELYFEKNGDYYPLYRFDSVFIFPKQVSYFSTKWVEQVLAASFSRLKDCNPEKVVKRASMKRAEMDHYYFDENYTAISHNTAPAKGIYLNAEQFKNNQPAYTDFEISFDNIVDMMRVKEKDGTYTLITKDWGFCDGEHLFMRMGANYFRLFKVGDTYDLYATEKIKSPYPNGMINVAGGGAGADLISAAILEALNSTKKTRLGELKPFQLDMETGRVY